MLQLSRLDWRIGVRVVTIAVVLAAALLTFLLLRQHKAADPVAGVKPRVYQSASNAPGDTLPLPPAGPRH
jgi:hypothetical protein